ncbi:MAG: protein-tyrosine phosphatase [Halioglobus sp.]
MNKKRIFKWILPIMLVVLGVIQFIPTPPVIIPADLPIEQREAHRLLKFEGVVNFRDLGGYRTTDNHSVKWGKLYRSGTFANTSRADLVVIQKLNLSTLIDFRSAAEKQEEPNVLPDPMGFRVVEIPTLDDDNVMVGDVMQRIESGNFGGFDPNHFMLEANTQLASKFTPQFTEFIHTILDAKGSPVVWHCSAGKDRTGFASAVVLKILGVPQSTIIDDYMMSKEYALAGRKNEIRVLRLFKGDEAADKLTIMMGVEESWLQAAFNEIDRQWGNFDNYVRSGLQLSAEDVAQLKFTLLE